MLFRTNPSLGVPIYLQLMEQVKHAVETGALRSGDQLPGIRPLAEELVVNPNTVAKAYRELEHDGVIETDDLRKTYDGVDALRGLTLQVPRGSIFGFLGKNGAGKTTTIKVLLGMAHATGGRASVFGLPPGAPDAGVSIRQRTGFVS